MSVVEQDLSIRQPEPPDLNVEEKPYLTPRELEILKLAAEGLSNSEIGRELKISRSTVESHFYTRSEYGKSHQEGILARLSARSRRGAVVRAIHLGILDPEKLVKEEEWKRCELLTRNEIKVLRCLADPTLPSIETTNLEIADKLRISPRKVKYHIRSILKTLKIERKPFIGSTRAAVIFLAYKRKQESTFPSHERLHELL